MVLNQIIISELPEMLMAVFADSLMHSSGVRWEPQRPASTHRDTLFLSYLSSLASDYYKWENERSAFVKVICPYGFFYHVFPLKL